MSSSSTNQKFTLKSCDGKSFEVDEAVARESLTIKRWIDDAGDKEIPTPNVIGTTLAKIIEYCKKHVEAATAISNEQLSESGLKTEDEHKAANDLRVWDGEFINNVDLVTLFDLIRASHYLEIQNLNDLGCQTVADMMRGKLTEEIREMFKIENDIPPEEEAQIKRENLWAFE